MIAEASAAKVPADVLQRMRAGVASKQEAQQQERDMWTGRALWSLSGVGLLALLVFGIRRRPRALHA